MIKAVIFDMDGVLIDAKEWHYEALNRALGLFGFEINRDDHVTTYDGLPTRKKLQMISSRLDLPKELHEFINQMKQIYTMELIHAHCKPRFIHEYALSMLKAKKYKLAVASNSIGNTVEIMMHKSHLTRYLDEILSTDDIKNAKPHPEIYLTAIARLGLKPAECLVVEDNENGIEAAKGSGANLLIVQDVSQVTFDNIMARICEIDAGALS